MRHCGGEAATGLGLRTAGDGQCQGVQRVEGVAQRVQHELAARERELGDDGPCVLGGTRHARQHGVDEHEGRLPMHARGGVQAGPSGYGCTMAVVEDLQPDRFRECEDRRDVRLLLDE